MTHKKKCCCNPPCYMFSCTASPYLDRIPGYEGDAKWLTKFALSWEGLTLKSSVTAYGTTPNTSANNDTYSCSIRGAASYEIPDCNNSFLVFCGATIAPYYHEGKIFNFVTGVHEQTSEVLQDYLDAQQAIVDEFDRISAISNLVGVPTVTGDTFENGDEEDDTPIDSAINSGVSSIYDTLSFPPVPRPYPSRSGSTVEYYRWDSSLTIYDDAAFNVNGEDFASLLTNDPPEGESYESGLYIRAIGRTDITVVESRSLDRRHNYNIEVQVGVDENDQPIYETQNVDGSWGTGKRYIGHFEPSGHGYGGKLSPYPRGQGGGSSGQYNPTWWWFVGQVWIRKADICAGAEIVIPNLLSSTHPRSIATGGTITLKPKVKPFFPAYHTTPDCISVSLSSKIYDEGSDPPTFTTRSETIQMVRSSTANRTLPANLVPAEIGPQGTTYTSIDHHTHTYLGSNYHTPKAILRFITANPPGLVTDVATPTHWRFSAIDIAANGSAYQWASATYHPSRGSQCSVDGWNTDDINDQKQWNFEGDSRVWGGVSSLSISAVTCPTESPAAFPVHPTLIRRACIRIGTSRDIVPWYDGRLTFFVGASAAHAAGATGTLSVTVKNAATLSTIGTYTVAPGTETTGPTLDRGEAVLIETTGTIDWGATYGVLSADGVTSVGVDYPSGHICRRSEAGGKPYLVESGNYLSLRARYENNFAP